VPLWFNRWAGGHGDGDGWVILRRYESSLLGTLLHEPCAVIVRDKTVLSTGYNGSIRGAAHCTEVGCLMENDHCIRTVHAEANALVQAARHGTRLEGAQIFVTASPCFNCFKLIVNSGIRSIYFGEFYRDERVIQFADELGIEMIHLGLADETSDE